jgi:hypothetical protein
VSQYVSCALLLDVNLATVRDRWVVVVMQTAGAETSPPSTAAREDKHSNRSRRFEARWGSIVLIVSWWSTGNGALVLLIV